MKPVSIGKYRSAFDSLRSTENFTQNEPSGSASTQAPSFASRALTASLMAFVMVAGLWCGSIGHFGVIVTDANRSSLIVSTPLRCWRRCGSYRPSAS